MLMLEPSREWIGFYGKTPAVGHTRLMTCYTVYYCLGGRTRPFTVTPIGVASQAVYLLYLHCQVTAASPLEDDFPSTLLTLLLI